MGTATRRDLYLEKPVLLAGQPKRTIAEYASQNGILVPRIFDSLIEAKRFGLPIIARSEHTQDYNGSSDLVASKVLREGNRFSGLNESELKKALDKYNFHTEKHCDLLGIHFEEFKKQFSYSFWEFIEGFQIRVVADSAIKSRYHITAYRRRQGDGEPIHDYSFFENGNVTNLTSSQMPNELRANLASLIDIYDSIRNLDKFDPNHCPIMEFVTTPEGKHYFLQYHRSRDFSQASFLLDRKPIKDEARALFVRGATPPEGITCKVTVAYGWIGGTAKCRLPKVEQGAFDFHSTAAYSEIMVRRRRLQITDSDDLKSEMEEFVEGHGRYSRLIKPEISVILDAGRILSKTEKTKLERQAEKESHDVYINVHLTSDGSIAYLRRA